MRIIITFLIMIIFSPEVFGGWFECYNYTGNLNMQKIDLSIQIMGNREGRIEGVYKYNRINTPIKLVGIERNGNLLILKELIKDSVTGKMNLTIKGDSIIGTWTSEVGNNFYPIKLKLVSKLIDTLYGSSFNNVEILFRQSTNKFYFIGSYSMIKDEYRASMDTLKVLDKKTNKIVCKICFSDSELFDRHVGNVMTTIYENLAGVSANKNGQIKQIRLTADLGRMGCDFPLNYDSKSNRFIINEDDLNSYAP